MINMREIREVKAIEGYLLEFSFDDGSRKMADIRPYLDSEAFRSLHDLAVFKQVENNKYYVS